MNSSIHKFAPLILKKDEDRRLRAGHVWVYSNEVDTAKHPLTNYTAGELVQVFAHSGRPLGVAYVNPHTLICARLLCRTAAQFDLGNLLHAQLRRALALRQQLFAEPYYRLVYGESDGLPGLVLDRYDALLVAQITTAGMERMKPQLLEAIAALLPDVRVIFRNDHALRELEGLSTVNADAAADNASVRENGCDFQFPLAGQKTGWFYDHRNNRARVQYYARARRVLDVFSYLGAFAICAAVAGARSVSCIESSASAAALLRDNAARNQVAGQVRVIEEDAFTAMKQLQTDRQQFDVVILDPPAFIKRRKDFANGFEAYRRINRLAMELLADGGLLFSASCSHHLSAADLQNAIRQAGMECGRTLKIIEQGHQAADHPIHPAIPETEYLKTFFVHITY